MNWRVPLNLLLLAGKMLVRHRTRSLLTLAGVAAGMFLFITIETVQSALRRATETNADDTVLVGRVMMKAEADRVLKERLRRKMRIREKIGDGRSYPMPFWVWRVGDAFLVGQPSESYSHLQTVLRRLAYPGRCGRSRDRRAR